MNRSASLYGWLRGNKNQSVARCAVPSGTLFLVVVNRFREPNPDVEDSQTAADSPNKAIRNERPQCGVCHQKMVVRPLWPPGKNDQKNAHDGADQAERQHGNPMQPKLDPHVTISFGMPR